MRGLMKPQTEIERRVAPGMEGLEKLAWLMDRAFTIPGTNIKVGLDAIIGLLPVGGDVLTGLVQIGIVMVALTHYKVPRAVAARMAANVLLDVGVGAVPLLGDVFDAFFKANTKNLHLLTQVQEQRANHVPVATSGSWIFLGVIALILISALALVVIGFVAVVTWVIRRPMI